MTIAHREFLIVDDDPQNNFISKRVLKKSLGQIQVKEFIVPEEALNYLQSEFNPDFQVNKIILLLDINMPTMSGWEFLEKFSMLEDKVKKQFDVYILSSSVDPRDIERAKENMIVLDFIEKPLGEKNIVEMFG